MTILIRYPVKIILACCFHFVCTGIKTFQLRSRSPSDQNKVYFVGITSALSMLGSPRKIFLLVLLPVFLPQLVKPTKNQSWKVSLKFPRVDKALTVDICCFMGPFGIEGFRNGLGSILLGLGLLLKQMQAPVFNLNTIDFEQ